MAIDSIHGSEEEATHGRVAHYRPLINPHISPLIALPPKVSKRNQPGEHRRAWLVRGPETGSNYPFRDRGTSESPSLLFRPMG